MIQLYTHFFPGWNSVGCIINQQNIEEKGKHSCEAFSMSGKKKLGGT